MVKQYPLEFGGQFLFVSPTLLGRTLALPTGYCELTCYALFPECLEFHKHPRQTFPLSADFGALDIPASNRTHSILLSVMFSCHTSISPAPKEGMATWNTELYSIGPICRLSNITSSPKWSLPDGELSRLVGPFRCLELECCERDSKKIPKTMLRVRWPRTLEG